MKVDVDIISDEIRKPSKSEVNRLNADYSKAKLTFGWTPSFSGIEGFSKVFKKLLIGFHQKKT